VTTEMTTRLRELLSKPQARELHDAVKSAEFLERGACPLGFLVRGSAPIEVLVNEYLEIHVDAFVKDEELGSIGLLHIVPDFASNAAERDWLRARIDESVYLRHLLLGAANEESVLRPLAYNVELTFCFRSSTSKVVSTFGEVLRELAKSGAFMHAVGIHLWDMDQASSPAWLLQATACALQKLSGTQKNPLNDIGAAPGRNRVDRMVLDNFRLAGRREIVFDQRHTTHLVYGPNGSGKSTLAEAIEIGVTGRIARIERKSADPDYVAILKNRETDRNPSIQLSAGPMSPIVRNGIADPLAPDLRAESMCLTQDLADRLAAGTPGERAAIFIEAFFPDKDSALAERRNALRTFREACEDLPEWLQSVNPADTHDVATHASAIAQSEKWIRDDSLPWQMVVGRIRHALHPENTDWLNELSSRTRDQFAATDTLTWNQVVARVREWDLDLQHTRTRLATTLEQIRGAISVLAQLKDLAFGGRPAQTGTIEDLFNQWLGATAEADLGERLRQVADTVRGANRRQPIKISSEFNFILHQCLAEADAAQEIQRAVGVLIQREADLRLQLAGLATTDAATRSTPSDTPIRSLEFDALDAAASLGALGPDFERCDPPLGQAVRMAVDRQRVVEVQAGTTSLQIGQEGWAVRLLERLENRQTTIQSFLASPAGPASLEEGILALRSVAKTAAAVEESDAKTAIELAQLLHGSADGSGGSLLAALNEVIAMLTPARWAYEPFRANVDFGSYEFSLEDSKGVPIALRLNTAELNATAVAFFLLCARHVDENPLKLLVLDDPLQNMDELTVTTVARAINKIVRLWRVNDKSTGSPPWHLWLLLHGQDDADRFRSEVPCAYYRLPWAVPLAASPDPSSTTKEDDVMSDTLQRLDRVLKVSMPAVTSSVTPPDPPAARRS
jgi:hypothetical protein